jgi:hypothetical protein
MKDVLAGLLLVTACAKQADPGVGSGPSSSSSARVASAREGAAPSGSPSARLGEASLDERSVRVLVDSWLDAQNTVDFTAYERLYAPRFTGIKRSGSRTQSYARAGWVLDRQTMFARPMRVAAKNLELVVTPLGAHARFEQTWSSGSYEDVGLKQLVIVPTAAGPRIAREEMLTSVLAGAESKSTISDLRAVHRDGLILSMKPGAAWVASPPRLATEPNVVLRDVDESKLPSDVTAWKGRAVQAFDAAGARCEAKVVGFTLRAQIVPHFGMIQNFRGELGTPPSTPTQIAAELWELAEGGGQALIGKLEPPCAGSLWALDAAKTAPAIAKAEPVSDDLKRQAVKAFRSLPSYATVQKQFVAEKKTGRWEEYENAAPSVTSFRSETGVVILGVAAQSGPGCGDFYGSLSAVFAMRPGQRLELLDEPAALAPLAAFDLDGNGTFELLFAEAPKSDERLLWRREARGGTLTRLFNVPFLDCPC